MHRPYSTFPTVGKVSSAGSRSDINYYYIFGKFIDDLWGDNFRRNGIDDKIVFFVTVFFKHIAYDKAIEGSCFALDFVSRGNGNVSTKKSEAQSDFFCTSAISCDKTG